MKKEIRNYSGIFVKIWGYSFLFLFLSQLIPGLIFLGINIDLDPDTLFFQLIRFLILSFFYVFIASMFFFFASIIYNQFKDKKFVWGIINTIALYLVSYTYDQKVNQIRIFAFIILIISCLWYYFKHIKSKFNKNLTYKKLKSKEKK